MSRPILCFWCVILTASLRAIPPAAAGALISNVQVREFTISPDGDGIKDSTFIYYTLSDSATFFSAVILSADTSAIIDSLVGGGPRTAGTATTVWAGRNLTGQIVPEGDYLLFLRAEGLSQADSLYRRLTVDLTVPRVTITSIQPSTTIAPGLDQRPLHIYFDVADAQPGDTVFTSCYILDPGGGKLSTLLLKDLEVGPHSVTWDGQNATADGFYQVKITGADNGGHTAVDMADIHVDLNAPVIKITSFISSTKFRVIPDSIRGWAHDASGLRPVEMRFRTGVPYFEIPSQSWRNDTLFFAAPLADSVVKDTIYVMRFRVSDLVGRIDTLLHRVELDTSSIPPIILNSPAGPVRSPNYLLTGTFEEQPAKIWIYRNDSLVDSLTLDPLITDISVQVVLQPGVNRFYVIASDDVGNMSLPSNTITVVFNAQAGLFFPQPFRPQDEFQINSSRAMVRVRLKIYDLGGDLVRALDYPAGGGTSLTIPWNGLNGESDSLHRGPLVVVAIIDYKDGRLETLREIFLFDP